jgi:hypothetical protein
LQVLWEVSDVQAVSVPVQGVADADQLHPGVVQFDWPSALQSEIVPEQTPAV